jgi:hypothetical protein
MDVRRSVSWTSRAGRTTSKGTRGRRERKKEKKNAPARKREVHALLPVHDLRDRHVPDERAAREGRDRGRIFPGGGGAVWGGGGGEQTETLQKKSPKPNLMRYRSTTRRPVTRRIQRSISRSARFCATSRLSWNAIVR